MMKLAHISREIDGAPEDGAVAAAPPAEESSTKKPRIRRTKEQLLLDALLLASAEIYLQEWTGECEVSGKEAKFLNIARGDTSLGSASINLTTGEFCDFADGNFKGRGMLQLYGMLNGISMQAAFDILKQQDGAAEAEPVRMKRQKKKPEPQPKPEAKPVDPESSEIPLPPDCHPDHGMVDQMWTFHTEEGKELFHQCRFNKADGKKEFAPVMWTEEGGRGRWVWRFPQGQLPLYRLPEVLAADQVVVCEGEKTADFAHALLNVTATTSAKGSGNAKGSDWTPMAGKHVTIIPDNDAPGKQYALDVAGRCLVEGALDVRVVNVSQWEPGEDIADHPEATEILSTAESVTDVFKLSELEGPIVAALAALPRGEYARRKKQFAEMLGIGTRDIDALVKAVQGTMADDAFADADAEVPEWVLEMVGEEPEPWPDPVNGDELFTEVREIILKHVVLKEEHATALAAWCLMTWVHMRLPICPKVLLTSPSKRCGKTTALEAALGLCRRPIATSNISPASVYRIIEGVGPTLLLDEADTFLADNIELAGVINSGHKRVSAYVTRMVKGENDEMVPHRFSTYAPIILAMIRLPKSDALIDRCIVIQLERMPQTREIAPLPFDVKETYADTRRRLTRWAEDSLDKLNFDVRVLPRTSNDRARENWAALATVGKAAGPDSLAMIEKAYTALQDTDALTEDPVRELLEGMMEVMAPKLDLAGDDGFIFVKEVVRQLNKQPHRPWADWKGGMTEHKLAAQLRPFKIKAKRLRRDAVNARGYLSEWFKTVFDQYGIGGEENTEEAK
jgi:hypothetical protein